MSISNNITSKQLLHLENLVFTNSQIIDASQLNYKKLSKSAKKELKQRKEKYIAVSTENLFFDIEIIISLQKFVEYLLSIIFNNPSLKVSFSSPDNTQNFIDYILKDRSFKNHIIYSLMDQEPKNIIGSNIISLLFLYIFKDKKMTMGKIKDFLSMYIVKSGFNFEIKSKLSIKQKVLFNQIKTGIKEEKIKNQQLSNYTEYKKSSKYFSIINIATNFVKIKYVSNLNGKHRSHKSPIIHFRKGTFRHYKNGKVVWVKSCIVNRDIA